MSTVQVINVKHPSSASNNIVLDSSGNASMAGSMAMATPFSMRNKIINGGMDIAQRGTSFTSQSDYTLDRWFGNRSGGASGVTFAQTYGAFGTTKNWIYIQRAAGNSSTATASLYQPIEILNCIDLAGKSVTASFTLGAGGTLSLTTNNVSVAVYYQTTTTDIGPNGSWTVISSTNFSVASSASPARYSATFSVPSSATQLELVLSFGFAGTASTDDRYYVTEVQLEMGTTVTPFERRIYSQELAMCQRYFQKTFDQATAPAQNAGTNGALSAPGAATNVSFNASWWFTCPMRAAPTIVTYSPDNASADWSDQGGVRPTAVVTTTGQTSVGIRGQTAVLAGGYYIIHATASAEL